MSIETESTANAISSAHQATASQAAAPRATPVGARPRPNQPSFPDSDSRSPGSRLRVAKWLKWSFVLIGVTGIGLAAIYFLQIGSSEELGPKMLHTISRSDLSVTIIEQGTLESSDNTEIKCKVRGWNTVIEIIDGGTVVEEGQILARLDTKAIDDAISLQTTNAHIARATLEESRTALAQAEIRIDAYLDGNYRSQVLELQRQLIIAEANLETAEKMFELSEKMFRRGYVSELEVEGNAFTVTQAQLELDVKKTELHVLEQFTKEMELETLRGNVAALTSKLEADLAGLRMDEGRRDRALEELEGCVIRAPKSGLVIYPSAAAWKDSPDVTEGANVRHDQVLLLMPDLDKMQIKVGIHESMVESVEPGQRAIITLPEQVIEGTVLSVANVTRPAGWWTGNVVKYDTIIELPSLDGLKPGMSAEVEIIIAEHVDVLTIPVNAVIETQSGHYCWVKNNGQPEKRPLQLGDSNDVFIVVESGLSEGDQVVMDPVAFVQEAQSEVLIPEEAEALERDSADFGDRDAATGEAATGDSAEDHTQQDPLPIE